MVKVLLLTLLVCVLMRSAIGPFVRSLLQEMVVLSFDQILHSYGKEEACLGVVKINPRQWYVAQAGRVV